MLKRCILILLLAAGTAQAAEPKLLLQDIPSVLLKLRRCTSGVFGQTCERPPEAVSAHIRGDGTISFYYKSPDTGSSRYQEGIIGSGATVDEALQALAAKLNVQNRDGAHAVEAIGILLPTQ